MPDSLHRIRIEAQARGHEAIEKINSLLADVDRRLIRIGEAAAGIYLVKQAFDASIGSLTASTRALIENRGAIDTLVNSYRALRLAITPTLATVGSLGAVVAVEVAVRTALRRAQLIERDAIAAGLAGEGGRTFHSFQTSTIAGRLLGGTAIPTSEPEKLARVAREASNIAAPFDRARLALVEFGNEAQTVLPLLTARTAEAIERAETLSRVLDQDTAAALARLDLHLKGPQRGLQAIADWFRDVAETSSVYTSRIVADAFRMGEAIAAGARAGAAGRLTEGISGGGLPGSTGPLLPFAPSEILRDRFTIVPEQDLNAFLARRARTLQGLEEESARLKAIREEALKGFSREGILSAERGLFAQRIMGVEPQIRLVEQRIIALRIAEDQLAESIHAAITEIERQAKVSTEATEKMMRGAFELFQRSPVSLAGEAAEAGRRLSMAPPPLTQLGIVVHPIESEAKREQLAAFGRGIVESERLRTALRKAAADQEISARIKILELSAGPGGELAAATAIRDIRLSTAKTELEAQSARLDFEVRIAEIQHQQQRELREGAGRVFDALLAGGAGIRQFAAGLALTTGRTIFQNVAQIALGGATGRLALPGTGTAASPTTLGRILAGTPFGAAPLDRSAVALTGSAVALTQAAGALAASAGVRIGGMAGGISGLSGIGGLSLPATIFGGASTSALGRPMTPAELVLAQSGSALPLGPNFGRGGSGLTTLGRGVGIAGVAAGGAFGAIAGLNQGGVQGGLTAGGSILGAAGGIIGLIPALAAATGPLAPIMLGVGLAAGVVASLLGDPKKRFAERQARQIQERQFTDTAGLELVSDAGGALIDRDRLGGFRRGAPIIQNFNINAIDSRSFIDHRGEILDAARAGLADGTGNAFMDDVRARLLPA